MPPRGSGDNSDRFSGVHQGLRENASVVCDHRQPGRLFTLPTAKAFAMSFVYVLTAQGRDEPVALEHLAAVSLVDRLRTGVNQQLNFRRQRRSQPPTEHSETLSLARQPRGVLARELNRHRLERSAHALPLRYLPEFGRKRGDVVLIT